MDEPSVASVTQTASPSVAQPETSLPPAGLESFLAQLIERQCRLLGAVSGAVMMAATRDHPTGLSAKYIADSRYSLSAKDLQRLSEIASRVARENRGVSEVMSSSRGLLSDRPDFRVLAAPLRLAGKPLGASVCVVPSSHDLDIDSDLGRLELSAAMFEAYLWRQQAMAEVQSKIQLKETLDLLDRSNQGHNTREMAALFAHELQRRFGCERVSIGLVRGHAVRIEAIGGVENLDRRSELVEAIEAVMEECADQDIEIRYPQPDDAEPSERRVVRAHAAHSDRFGPTAIASFPLRIEDGLIGVVTMERVATDPFNDATLALLRLIAEYLGPTLWTRRLADRGVLAVSRDRLIDAGHTMVGPEKTGAKIIAAVALLLLLFSVIVPVRDRVVAEGRIIALERRQISAPYEGQIAEAFVLPGDKVTAGQPLIRLDVRERQFELSNARSDAARLRIEADSARAEGDNAKANMLEAQIRMSMADIAALEYEIERAEIDSPIDGTVTRGRLEDLVGEVVTPESPLIEVAQLGTIEAIVLVPEQSISRVRDGQFGRLALTARPGEKVEFRVKRITPSAEVIDGRNVYRVDVELIDPPEWLRPGMEGQAKLTGKRSNLLTIYSRPIVDAAKMRFWWR